MKYTVSSARATLAVIVISGLFLFASIAQAVQSPPGCTADNSVVNISGSPGTAVAGDVITFTVSAGNPASVDGCDITGRTLTLTLPDGSVTAFGPFNYPNPTATAVVGSAPYVADNGDAAGGVWTANVSWDGTLKSSIDLPSNGSKNASVIQIQPLVVEKTSRTAHQREWDWTIEKSADETELLLAEGESFTVNYTIEVDATIASETLDASGMITITNPVGNPSATITGVTDVLSVDGAANVTCPVTFPHVLAAGDNIVCTYQIVPAAATDQTNTATVATSGSVPGGSDTVDVNFDGPTEIDECIVIDDTNPNGPQDVEICQDDADKTIDYSVTFGPEENQEVDVPVSCGEDSHPNTASFETQDDQNDTDETGSADETVNINVECDLGCTLTQGYWKTHNDSFKGGAPTDDNWEDITPDGELSGFFTTINSYPVVGPNIPPFTWFSVFGTAPKGNAYYNLAHQYMAAKLNVLNGATAPGPVATAITNAENFFDGITPAAFAALGKKDPLRAQVIGWAGTLGAFNEGSTGPGHCDEQNPI